MKFRYILVILIMVSVGLIRAQENLSAEIMEHLTQSQKEMLKKEKQQIIKNREIFKATLSEQQKQILRDKTLNKEEIRQRLRSTFTQQQLQLLKAQQQSLKETRESFRQSLTAEQKNMVRDHMHKTKESKDREEIRSPRDNDHKRRPGGPPPRGGRK